MPPWQRWRATISNDTIWWFISVIICITTLSSKYLTVISNGFQFYFVVIAACHISGTEGLHVLCHGQWPGGAQDVLWWPWLLQGQRLSRALRHGGPSQYLWGREHCHVSADSQVILFVVQVVLSEWNHRLDFIHVYWICQDRLILFLPSVFLHWSKSVSLYLIQPMQL